VPPADRLVLLSFESSIIQTLRVGIVYLKMKTMLKRKLTKTGLISNGLLLLIAAVSVAATRQISDATQRTVNDSTVQQLSFDTMLLRLNGISEMDAFDFPAISLNNQGVVYVKNYLAKNGGMLQKIKGRSSSFFAITDKIFSKYSLPLELKYLAVVESQLKLKAVSRVGAVGAWQLMPATARVLSLKITGKYDERTHLYKSTVAAAKYLRDLYKEFGDWLLVIAAYNSGPGKVYQAIKKSGSRNFWKLQNYLPSETRAHVKKFISTHYYFEKQGGITTLTKEEIAVYKKAMIAFVEEQNMKIREEQIAEIISITDNHSEDEEKIVNADTNTGVKFN
jgi:membrane-bound lytic murein transglycosylase D